MKRIAPYLKENYGIKTIKPIFKWIQCDVCKNEFKSEKMWKVWIKNIVLGDYARWDYVCMGCCKTERDVIEYRCKVRKLISRPIPSPHMSKSGESKGEVQE